MTNRWATEEQNELLLVYRAGDKADREALARRLKRSLAACKTKHSKILELGVSDPESCVRKKISSQNKKQAEYKENAKIRMFRSMQQFVDMTGRRPNYTTEVTTYRD